MTEEKNKKGHNLLVVGVAIFFAIIWICLGVYSYIKENTCPSFADYCDEMGVHVEMFGRDIFCQKDDFDCYEELDDMKKGIITKKMFILGTYNACVFGCNQNTQEGFCINFCAKNFLEKIELEGEK